MEKLYFYKLVSPYLEDETKDCKLTVSEIDSNFLTLKDADIKSANYDETSKKIILNRNNGETLEIDISSLNSGATAFSVDYDSVEGRITITYDNKQYSINGLVTTDNIQDQITNEVITDNTLKGKGSDKQPLGLSLVERTGLYTPAKKFINLAKGEFLPSPEYLNYGDTFLVHEKSNEYGLLYNFSGVKKINEDLSRGWRVPTKTDWDNMLNAIEPSEEDRNHNSAMSNVTLGKYAGKLLKSRDKWLNDPTSGDTVLSRDYKINRNNKCSYDDPIFAETVETEEKTLQEKEIDPIGSDTYMMSLVPAGFSDGCQVTAYFGKRGEYWSSTITNSLDVYTKRFDYDKAGVVQCLESTSSYYSLRLVKDYDGQNFHETESINGQDYRCVLVPTLNTKYGFSIWTAANIAFANTDYAPILPNNGEGLDSGSTQNYFIYSWNGGDFVKKPLRDGEAIVLQRGLKGEVNGEYRLMRDELVNTSDVVYSDVMYVIEPRLERIEKAIGDKDHHFFGRLISKRGCRYDNAKHGVLTLMTDDPRNAIYIPLNGDYGVF